MAADPMYCVLADGLIARAETRPKHSESARHLREAAASLLDADMATEREGPANDDHAHGAAA